MTSPYVITIASDKGGVGKTTLATNLAIYLKAIDEDLPVTLLSLDNHFSVDRMFRLGRQKGGEVSDLFAGCLPEDILETGEFGVQFIPSSRHLRPGDLPNLTEDSLARTLVRSRLGGVVIIDTRPDLEIFTRNALFVADRVIVPVKDTPSLENARHIYEFFDSWGLSRRSLRLLPCLVDSRIRFEGPFKDPYQLLKAYAINRGYRCLEGFVSKSPKVESLNTNPEGKIYPILTCGRQTDVHLQFTRLARQIYNDFRENATFRLASIAATETLRLEQDQDAFSARRRNLAESCLLCGRPVVTPEAITGAGYYAEAFKGGRAAFLEETCFLDLVFSQIYHTSNAPSQGEAIRELFRESAQRSYFVFRRAPESPALAPRQVTFHRFDEDGLEVSRRSVALARGTGLHQLLTQSVMTGEDRWEDDFLVVCRVSTDFPEEILQEGEHTRLRAVMAAIARQLSPEVLNE